MCRPCPAFAPDLPPYYRTPTPFWQHWLPLFDQIRAEHCGPAMGQLGALPMQPWKLSPRPTSPCRWNALATALDASHRGPGPGRGAGQPLQQRGRYAELRAFQITRPCPVSPIWTCLGPSDAFTPNTRPSTCAAAQCEQRQAMPMPCELCRCPGAELTGAAKERFAANQGSAGRLGAKNSARTQLDVTDA